VKKMQWMLSMGAVAMLGAGLVLSGCKSAPPLTAADAQKLIQAKYDAQPAVPAAVTVDDTGMQQGFAAKYWTRTKQYPNKFWADFTLTDEGKKAIKLSTGKDVIEWRPVSATDKTFKVVVMTAVANHLKARDVQDPLDDGTGGKTVIFNEAFDLTGVPQPLVDIAHNPGNKLATKHTANFVLDNGAWKLASID
jgi:hypothetical protein